MKTYIKNLSFLLFASEIEKINRDIVVKMKAMKNMISIGWILKIVKIPVVKYFDKVIQCIDSTDTPQQRAECFKYQKEQY